MKKVIHKKFLREGYLVSIQQKYFTVLVQYPNGMVYHRQDDVRIIESKDHDKGR